MVVEVPVTATASVEMDDVEGTLLRGRIALRSSIHPPNPSLLLIHHHVGIVHLDGVLSCFPRLQVVLGWSRSSRQLVQGCVVELPIPCSGAARSMGVDLLAQTCKRSPGAAYVELDRPQGQSQRALSRSNE